MMREGWTYKKLGEVADIKSGYTPSSEELLDNGALPYFKVGDMNVEGNEKYLNHTSSFLDTSFKSYPQNSIVFPKNGAAIATNKKRILSKPSVVDLNTAVLISKTNTIFTEFLYYWICKVDFKNITRRGTIPTLDIKTLMQFVVPVPPLSEQERIVSELDLLSGIIEKKKAQLKEYDKLAQSIFYDMFGDPVTNEKGWEVKKLGEVCEYAKTRVRSESITTYNYVGVDNLLQNCQGKTMATKVPDSLGLTEYWQGDVLIGNIRPYLKKIWLATEKGGCNGDVLAIRRKEEFRETINTMFLLKCLSTYRFFDFAMQFAKGEKMPRGDKKEIMKFIVPLPPLPLQQSFASKIEAIERQKALIQQSITETETLFNSRMDYYFD